MLSSIISGSPPRCAVIAERQGTPGARAHLPDVPLTPKSICNFRHHSLLRRHGTDHLEKMPDDRVSSRHIVLGRRWHIGPVGDLSMPLQVGRDLIKRKDLCRSGRLFRRKPKRDVSGWSESIAGQAITDARRDIVVYGNATRNG